MPAVCTSTEGMDTYLPDDFLDAVRELLHRDDIRSVSCALVPDARLWQIMVDEQLRRVAATGLPAEDALFIAGRDQWSDINPGKNEWFEEIRSWGGSVHIPYEGTCGGDLFFVPEYWRANFDDAKKEGAKLRWAVKRPCNYVLVELDHGELPCATRTRIGKWTLYTSTAPHVDCHPIREAQAHTEALLRARGPSPEHG